MALSVSSGLTTYDDCTNSGNWTAGATETDWYMYNSVCMGMDVDAVTLHSFGPTLSSPDWSSATGTPQTIYAWFLCMTSVLLDIKANGGIRLCVMDSSSNESYWYVGGVDTFPGGWEVLSCNTAEAPDGNNGTNADLTDVYRVGVGFKGLSKSKLAQNCFWDWVRYGSGPALSISGTNTSTGLGWSEVYSLDISNAYGILTRVKTGYLLKGPIQLGDSSGTSSTNFTDYNTLLTFADMPVGDFVYKILIRGNSTGTTDIQLGSVVGSGSDRQGLQGNNIVSTAAAWEWDSDTYISTLDSVYLYGCTFIGCKVGVGLDDDTITSVISTKFINCGEILTGSTNDGAEILNSFIIDPADQLGLSFTGTPSGGTLSHNVSNIRFITSETPTTQYMTYFTYAGDYAVAFTNMQFFGTYTSSTIQHGLNAGLNADITINATGTTNASSSEFTNSNGGTVTVSASVPVKVTVKDTNGTLISGAQTSIYLLSDDSVVMNEDTDGSGIAEDTFSGSTPAAVVIRVRKSSTGTRYAYFSTIGTIQASSGLDTVVIISEDLNIT